MGDGDLRAHLPIVSPPRRRGDCEGIQRPCSRFACRHNLSIDDTAGGRRFTTEHSCILDVVEEHGSSLEHIGELFGITRERIRQLQPVALRRWWILLADSPNADQMLDEIGDLLGVDAWAEVVLACREELGTIPARKSSGNARRVWSPKDEDRLEELWRGGDDDDAIAVKMGRTAGAVRIHRYALGYSRGG